MDRENKEETIKCDICDSELDEDSGNIVGEFGISTVAFCVWCLSSMTDMVIQLNGFDDIPTLQERIIMLREEQGDESVQAMQKYTAKLRKELKENK